MKTAGLFNELEFNENRVSITVMLETDFTKEIRVAMMDGQVMKRHMTRFPIVIAVAQGSIELGVESDLVRLDTGDLVALEGGVLHDLTADGDTVVRLTLSKSDEVDRVEKAVKG